MVSALFLFFEAVAEELCQEDTRVITRADLELNDSYVPLFDDLQQELGATNSTGAVIAAVDRLHRHFADKGSALPFDFNKETGRFNAVDRDYLHFICAMSQIRSIGVRSYDFELGVLGRLAPRITGSLHRVGFPRKTMKTRQEFNEYLRGLGFNGKVLVGKEKDGGFDILWLLPLGTVPHRPVVSMQCKNGVFNLEDAHASVMDGGRSLSQHAGLQQSVHVPCVLFNDYFTRETFSPKQLGFVPLGLSDLSTLQELMTHHSI